MLVTHQLQFLTDVPKIMVLKENKVAACGDFAEITRAGFNIVEILQSHNKALNKEIADTKALGKDKKTKSLLKKLSSRAQEHGVKLDLDVELEESPEPKLGKTNEADEEAEDDENEK